MVPEEGERYLVYLSTYRLRSPHACIASLCTVELLLYNISKTFFFFFKFSVQRRSSAPLLNDLLYVQFSSEISEQKGKKCSDLSDVMVMKEICYKKILTEFPNIHWLQEYTGKVLWTASKSFFRVLLSVCLFTDT